jgi:hypothetical protein
MQKVYDSFGTIGVAHLETIKLNSNNYYETLIEIGSIELLHDISISVLQACLCGSLGSSLT